MEDVLAELKHRKIKMAVVSSNDQKVLNEFIDQYFPGYFEFVEGGVSLFHKAKVLDKLLQQHQIDRKTACYVGDEVRDIQAAQKVGLTMVSVAWGLQSRNLLEQYQPSFLVDSPQEFLKVVPQLMN